jgi:DNA-binding SARP family transcriptional activator
MTAYAGLGNYNEVREEYKHLEIILQEELGICPDMETQKLFTRLCQRG